MSTEATREFAATLSDDELAQVVSDLRQQAAELRQNVWCYEDVLRDRLISRNAKRLQGDKYLVKSSIKREIKWDQAAIAEAGWKAESEGKCDLFVKAFPPQYGCSIRNMNELLKHGGETAKAVEAAMAEVRERLELEISEL
jgi:hypothetical protein